jgi:hypothetical protein
LDASDAMLVSFEELCSVELVQSFLFLRKEAGITLLSVYEI